MLLYIADMSIYVCVSLLSLFYLDVEGNTLSLTHHDGLGRFLFFPPQPRIKLLLLLRCGLIQALSALRPPLTLYVVCHRHLLNICSYTTWFSLIDRRYNGEYKRIPGILLWMDGWKFELKIYGNRKNRRFRNET